MSRRPFRDKTNDIKQIRNPAKIKKITKQKIVQSALNFFSELNNRDIFPQSAKKTTSLCLGISYRSVARYTGASNNEEVENRTPRRVIIGEEEIDLLCKIIHSFYAENKPPTLDMISEQFFEQYGDTCSKHTIYRSLKRNGFRWRKIKNNMCVVIEKPRLVEWRKSFIHKMRQLRIENRRIYYTDETWYNTADNDVSGWAQKLSTDTAMYSRSNTVTNKGQRVIILHAGGTNGFVQGAEYVMCTKDAGNFDYHQDMDAYNFEKWLEFTLFPLITGEQFINEKEPVLVMDNAPYHTRKVCRKPTMSWLKEDLINVLCSHGYVRDPLLHLKKRDLIIECEKLNLSDKFAVEALAAKFKVIVVRLPPYHCHLNPIELVWSQVKRYVRRNNVTQNISDCKRLIKKAFNEVSVAQWSHYVSHVIGLENEAVVADDIVEECEFHEPFELFTDAPVNVHFNEMLASFEPY
ncbi:uncharacterized protein B4U80_05324 [Leptotrombidium deliense]|uniref:Tc1-like transposase DDE domain-containing protein n=1 Tax=Leptotrombidium deliense TaxID=299467 RepID=A0A443S0F4_9ACAR|nr:uncharacterized protein B4U80_05324 [Leptotrombidium deliense]